MWKRMLCAVLALALMVLPASGNLAAMTAAAEPAGQSREMANVVLFACFQDESSTDYFNAPNAKDPGKTNAQAILALYDGTDGRSFARYMQTISGGRLTVHNVFPQWDGKKVSACVLPFTKAQAQSSNIDYSLLTALLQSQLPAAGAQTDYDGDGVVDNLTVVLVGAADNASGALPSLYPHQNTYTGTGTYGGKQVGSYVLLNTDRLLDSAQADGSGVICHEFLHVLGYPDLYTRDGSLPVGQWDIMGASSRYLSYPLAYLRAHFTGWLTLPELTESKTGVTLSAPGQGGTQAYVLRSPSNPYERFVVEMRQKGTAADPDSLDAAIGGTGLIVYRVDTTVAGLSNYAGGTGVYVFRPQAGQNGYVAGNEKATLQNAFLSAESGRTAIGSADLDKGLSDGALTFTDGTNSGIVISNVSAAAGGTVTFDVTIPEAAAFDLWQDTGFAAAGTGVTVAGVGGKVMAAGYHTAYAGDSLQLYAWDGSAWQAAGTPLTQKDGFADVTLTDWNGQPVAAWRDSSGQLTLSRLTASGWEQLAVRAGVAAYALAASADGLHLAWIDESRGSFDNDAMYGLVTAEGLTETGSYATGFLGSPQIGVTGAGQVYLACRSADSDQIQFARWDAAAGRAQTLASPGTGNSYTMAAWQDAVYLAIGAASGLTVQQYTAGGWRTYAAQQDVEGFRPQLAVAQGNLYVIANPARADSAAGLRVYAVESGSLTQEGLKVDKDSSGAALAAAGDTLFAAYTLDGKACVKQKTTVNRLLSLTITPPDKTSYVQGETVSLDGLQVTANYTRSTRPLKAGEYQVTGFDTAQTGERTAAVTYEGVSGAFVYLVSARAEVTPTPTATAAPTAAPTAVPVVPTAAPTPAPTATARPAATRKPAATAKPTAAPTIKPTATASPTASPTAAPSAPADSAAGGPGQTAAGSAVIQTVSTVLVLLGGVCAAAALFLVLRYRRKR